MRIGALIKAWREANRYGTREASRIIGVSAATLNRVENGRATSGASMARIMIWAFGSEIREVKR